MCSVAVQSAVVKKRLNDIFEEYVRKRGLDEIEKCVNEASKV